MRDKNKERVERLSEAVTELAERVGTPPIWDLLVNLGSELPDVARQRAGLGEEWRRLAVQLDRALETAASERIWAQVRQTLRLWEAEHLGEPADKLPVMLKSDWLGCQNCAANDFLVRPTDPTDFLGWCAGCEAPISLTVQLVGSSEQARLIFQRRRQAIAELTSTRQMIEQLDARNPYESSLTLVPLYRLAAQHMQRIRRMTAELLDLYVERDPTTVAQAQNI